MSITLATSDGIPTSSIHSSPQKVFQGKARAQRVRESGVALSGPVLHFAADSAIYAEGDLVRSFYKVVSGVVRTCKFLADGRRQIDGFYREGDIFGLELDAEHRLCAEAVCECTVIAYRWTGLAGMKGKDEKFVQQFFPFALRSLRRAQDHSLLLGRRSAAQKMAAFLLEMARQGDSTGVFDLAMTRQDIADYLGLTIETVSRTLSQFERDRIIALPSARNVVLRNSRALEELNE